MLATTRLLRISFRSVGNRFLSAAATSSAQATSGVTTTSPQKIVDPNDKDVLALEAIKNPTSAKSFFNSLQFINRRNNPTNSKFTLWGLFKMYSLVTGPDDGKFAILLTKQYQLKGFDFTEQVAAAFARAAVTGGVSNVAAELCAEWKNRMGAWLPPVAVHDLVEDLCKRNDLEPAVNMLETVSKKGTIAKSATIDLLLSAISQHEKAALWNPSVLSSAAKMIPSADLEDLKAKYPTPKAADPPVAESETAVEASAAKE